MSAPSSPDDPSFLSRWSRRKLRAGADPAPAAPPAAPPPNPVAERAGQSVPLPVPALAGDQPPPPTLDDLEPLDHTADLTRFIAKGVDEGVRRAALHKLFTDPQFNVMDGLDTYIDDYNAPSPMAPGLLARLKLAPDLSLDLPEPAAATRMLEQAAAERPSSTPEESAPGSVPDAEAAADPFPGKISPSP